MNAFKPQVGNLPVALSTFARADITDIDWAPWRDAGFHLLPQAYPNEVGELAIPGYCEDGGEKAGWPKNMVHVTVGLHGHKLGYTATQAVQSLEAAGAHGISLYLPENVPQADWSVYGDAIINRNLAHR